MQHTLATGWSVEFDALLAAAPGRAPDAVPLRDEKGGAEGATSTTWRWHSVVPVLIEFCGLPGTGKTTLSRLVAADTGGILLRVDAIEAALQRHGLVPGAAGYAVAHDLAEAHLRRGFTVIVDAVSPVEAARAGWRDLARACGVPHRVIETHCEPGEHRRRVTDRRADIPGLVYPTWDEVVAREYEPRTDDRLVVDTARPVSDCLADIADHLRNPKP